MAIHQAASGAGQATTLGRWTTAIQLQPHLRLDAVADDTETHLEPLQRPRLAATAVGRYLPIARFSRLGFAPSDR